MCRRRRRQGFPVSKSLVWYGVTAPRGTRASIIARLEHELLAVMKSPEVRERMAGMGLEVTPPSAEAFGLFLRTEQAKWAALVRASGARPD